MPRLNLRAEHVVTVVLVLCACAALLARLHRLDLPFERDEGEYAYIAQRMLLGDAPWTEANTMKLPGVPLCYALAFLLFGESVRAAHLAALFADLISAVALAWWCHRVVVDPVLRTRLAAWAACSFIVVTTLSVFQGLVANCEKFVVAFVLLAFAALSSSTKRWHLLLAGCAAGCAFVCKQQILPVVAVCGAACVLRDHGAQVAWRQRILDGVAMAAGMALPWIALVVMVALWGSFDAFWFQTVTYARAYVGTAQYPMRHALAMGQACGREPVVVVALVGVVAAIAGATLSRHTRVLVAAWWAASVVALSIGLYFRPHYFIFAVPVLAMGLAVLASRRWWTAALVVCAMLASVVLNGDHWWRLDDNTVSKRTYRQTTFVEAVEIARVLQQATTDDERILILGSEPEVLFLAHRRSVTPYIYFYPLMERQPFAQQQQAEVIDDVTAAAPSWVVLSVSTLRNARSVRGPLAAWATSLLDSYEVVWPASGPRRFDTQTLKSSTALVLLRRSAAPGPAPAR